MIDSPNLDPKVIRNNQTVRFPDMLSEINGHKVRYRICVDSSFLNQSKAFIDVWSETNLCWNEVWNLHLDSLFEIASGPDNNKKCIDPDSPQLASVHNPKGAEFIAKSWQKIVIRLCEEASEVLR